MKTATFRSQLAIKNFFRNLGIVWVGLDACALVKNPEIVIADEPTASLDSANAFAIVELMKELNETEKSTFVFSTHDGRVLKYLDRVMLIEDGLIKDRS